MSTTQQNPLPPPCARTRDAFGLQLVDGSPPGSEAEAHVKICPSCALVIGRMREVWDTAGDALPSLKPAKNLDAILERVIAGQGEIEPAEVLPFKKPRERRVLRRSDAIGVTIGLALAASLFAFSLLIPQLFETPVTPIAEALKGAPKVVLSAAKGDVSHVPADGSVMRAPVAGDALPPGLFAATGGAALAIEGQGLLAVRGDSQVWIGGAEGAPELAIARGEIFVDLPKGTIQTFIVRTPSGAVHVTGTQFDVKVKKDSTRVDVTRGSVKLVVPAGETAVLEGQSGHMGAEGVSTVALVVSPVEDPLSWVRDLAPDRVPAAAVVAMAIPKRATVVPAADDLDTLVTAGLPRLVVENAMDKREASMRYCYEQALVQAPDLRVRLAIRFTVDEDGRPESLRVDGVPAQHDKLRACILEAASAARFPATAPGTEVRISYPVKLEPAGDESPTR